jgi:hypothetical protein
MTITALALSIAVSGLTAINAAEQQLNPKAISVKLPNQIPWKRNSAATNETALLYGDPDKPGFHVLMFKWLPGQMSPPHWHPHDRMITVSRVHGGSAPATNSIRTRRFRSDRQHVTHTGKEVHYNDAKDGEVWLLMAGEGPAMSTPASTPPPAH